MTAHVVVTQRLPETAGAVFDLVHDYPRRLEWDTLLRRAETVDDAAPARGVVAVCTARRALGGFSFRTRYVSYDPPVVAAVVLTDPVLVFAKWAASIRHADHGDGSSEVTYTMTFSCRPAWAAPVVEPVARWAFRLETAKRLQALRRHLAR